jgi:hypothetical protein
MYKFVDCHYDRESLIELFSVSNKARIKSLYQVTDDLIGKDCIDSVFAQFPNIAHNRYNVELGEFFSYTKPYISPKNNGLLIIPLRGKILINFFSYSDSRENLHPSRNTNQNELSAIRNTLIEQVVIDRPFLFNGLVVHDYKPTEGRALALILKIPLNTSWDSL